MIRLFLSVSSSSVAHQKGKEKKVKSSHYLLADTCRYYPSYDLGIVRINTRQFYIGPVYLRNTNMAVFTKKPIDQPTSQISLQICSISHCNQNILIRKKKRKKKRKTKKEMYCINEDFSAFQSDIYTIIPPVLAPRLEVESETIKGN